MRKFINTVLLASLLFLAGCSSAPAAQNLVGTSWALLSLDGDTQVGEMLGGQAVTLSFDSITQAGGSGGCNSFGATYKSTSSTGSIAFSDIVSTLMACLDEGIGEVETAYFAALNTADHYEVSGRTLTITGDGHTLIFERTTEGT